MVATRLNLERRREKVKELFRMRPTQKLSLRLRETRKPLSASSKEASQELMISQDWWIN